MLRLFFLLLASPFAFAQQPLPPGAFARLGGTALRHPDKPNALAFRPGTAELASLGSDGTVRIWDTATGKELHLLRKKDHVAHSMAFSANGAFLAVHFGDKQLWIYNPAKKYETATFARVPMLDGMSITDDGKLVAGMAQGEPVIVEIDGDARETLLPVGTAVAVSPDGKSVAVARKDETTRFVDVLEMPSGKRMLRMVRPGESKAAIDEVVYAPDSRTLAMASDELAPIVIFQLGKEEPLAKFEGSGPVAWANRKMLCGRKANRMAVWDTAGKVLHENLGNDVSTFSLTGDGKLAATDASGVLGSPRIRLWSISESKKIDFDEGPICEIIGLVAAEHGVNVVTTTETLDWSPGKKNIFRHHGAVRPPEKPSTRRSSVMDGSFEVVGYALEKPHLEIVVEHIRSSTVELSSPALGLAVHSEGKSFAAITRDGFIRVWDREGKELWTARTTRSLRAGIAYSPDGKMLVATSIMKVMLYDSADGKELASVGRQWEDGPFTSICFNHDGSLFAVGSQGFAGSTTVFETASRTLVKRFEGLCGSTIGVAFCTKSDDLVSAHSDDSLIAWHTHTPGKATDPAKLWEALASKEGEVAWPAMMQLVELKEKAEAVIAEGMNKEAKSDGEKLRRQRAEVVLKRIKSAQK